MPIVPGKAGERHSKRELNQSEDSGDIFRNIGPLMLVSRVWGLMPRVAARGPLKKLLAFAYSFAASLLYAYVLYAFNANALDRIERAAANVKLLVKIIYVETTLRCVLLCALLVVNSAKSGHFLRILRRLADFDNLLERKLRGVVDVPTARNVRLQIVYAVYVVFFGCYYGGQLCAAQNGIALAALWAALSNVTLIILSQFTVFVHAFYLRFKTFNAFFAAMNGPAPQPGGASPFDDNASGRSRKARRSRERLNVFRLRTSNALNQFELRELHVIYVSMRDLLREINSYYAFQVLLIVCETIAILIAGISTVTFNITGDDFSSKTFDRQLTLLHCGLRLLNVTLLIYVAERTSCELELFLLDLWHHKVKLNAHDFFDLDYQLIQSILSAATTYVIVLVQFQLATTYAS